MKRILVIVLGIVVLGVIGAAAAVMRLDAKTVRDHVAEAVRGATGKPLVIQDIPQISFIPLGVKFGAASWGDASGGKAGPGDDIYAAVKNGQISLQFIPLLSGKILIDEVILDGPDLRLRIKKDAPVQKNAPPGAEDAKTPPDSKAAPPSPIPPQLEINRLRLTNASIHLETDDMRIIRLSRCNFELDDLKAGAEMRLDLAAELAVNKPALEGAIALKAKARLQTRNYELRDTALRFTPAGGIVPPAAGPIDLALQANYAPAGGKIALALLKLAAQGGKIEISGSADAAAPAFNGRFKIDGAPRELAQAFGVKLPFKKGLESFILQSSLNLAGQTLALGSIQGMLDTTAIDGKLSLELDKMHVAGNLNLGTLNLDALMASAPLPPAPLNSASAESAAPGAPAEAMAATPRKKAPAKAAQPAPAQDKASAGANSALPSVNMELTCASLTASRLQFRDIRAKIRGRGQYHIEPLTLSLGTGGTANLNIGVDAVAMRCTAAGKVSNVAVGPLLQALQGKRPADGTANLDLDNIACAGTTPKAMQSSLSGKGRLTVRGIVLNDVSILPKDAPAGLGKPPTHFEQLTVPFTASAGIVNMLPVVLTSPSAGLKGRGVVRLPQEDAHFTADVSLLKTAVIPIQVSGPFTSLSYGLDGKRALQILTQTPGALMDAATGLGGKALRQGGNIGQKAGDAAGGAKNMLKGVFRP